MAKFNNAILLILIAITLVITTGSVSAFNLQTFNDSTTTGNLTFIGNTSVVIPWDTQISYITNFTKGIRIPQYVDATISSAFFNLSGYRTQDPTWYTSAINGPVQAGNAGSCGAVTETNPGSFIDKTMNSYMRQYVSCSSTGSTGRHHNFTVQVPAVPWSQINVYAKIQRYGSSGDTGTGIYVSAWNYNTSAFDNFLSLSTSATPTNYTRSLAYDPKYVNASGAMIIKTYIGITGMYNNPRGIDAYFYDLTFTVNATYPTTFNVTVNNSNQIFYSSSFTTENNKLTNFAPTLNTYLSSCNYTGGYCHVPVSFFSSTSGRVEYENIDIKAYELVYSLQTGSANITFDTVPINTTANPYSDVVSFGTNQAYLNNLNIYPEFNRSANITLFGATRTFLRPVIYRRDGTYCTDCTIYSSRMDTGTVSFHVPNFNAGGYYMGEAIYYDTGLLGYWPFNVNSLSDTKDSMPFSASSPMEFIYGGVGNTGRINVTGYDQLSATGPAISGNASRTINFWAQFLDNRTQQPINFVTMYSLGALGNNTAFRIGVKDSKWYVLGGNGTGGFTENDWNTNVAVDSNWHMHTLTYDTATANLTWYIDNTPRASWIHNYATTQTTQYINPAENRYTINCYQETANQSSGADGGDVECSRYYNYTGVYAFQNTTDTQWTNPQLTYDGNWGTGGSGGDDVNYSIMYINYSIPTSAQTNSQWYVKFQNLSGTGIKNLSLASCQFTTGTLRLRIFAESTNRTIRIYCANAATTWYEWTNWYNSTIETPIGLVYEEAVNWTLIGNKPRLLMDELGVWNRVLNSSERTSLYQGNVYAVNNNPVNRFIDSFTYVNDSHPTLYVNGSYLNNWQKRRYIDRIVNSSVPLLVWYVPISYAGTRNLAFINPDNLSQSYPCYIDGYDGTYTYARILKSNITDLYVYYDAPSRTSTDNSYYCSDYKSVLRYPSKDNIIDVFTYFNSQASLYGRTYAENFTSPGFKGSYGTSSYFGRYYTIYQEEVGIHFNKSMMQDYPGHFNYSIMVGMYQLSWNFWSGAPFFRFGNRTSTLFWANANGNDNAYWYDYEGHSFPSPISRGSNRPFVINGYGNESVITHDIYYDGVFKGQFNTTWNGIEDGGFTFGGNATYKMPGNQLGVDEIVLFNRTLTQEEINEWTWASIYGPGSVLYIGDEEELNETGLPGYNASAVHALETGAVNNTVNFTATAVDRVEIENVTLTVNNQTGSLVNRTTIDLTGYTTRLISIPVFLVDGIYNIFWTIFGHTGSSYTTPNTELDVYSTIIPLVFLPPSPTNGANTTATLYQMNLNVSYNLVEQADYRIELYNETGLMNSTVIFPNNGPNYYNYTIPEDGYYQFRAIAINPGNVYSILNNSIVKDTQNPTYTIVGPGASSARRNVMFNNTFSDVNGNHIVSGIRNATLFVTDGGSYNNLTEFQFSGAPVTSGQIIMPLNDGYYNYTWNVYDFSDNNYSTTTSLTVSSIPPTIEFVSPVDGANLSRNNMSIVVNVSENTEFIDYYVWNDTGIINYSRRTAIWPYVDGINFINMTFANGYYSFNASAINAEFNDWTETRTMLIDSTPPFMNVAPFNYSNLSIVDFLVYNISDNYGLFNISYTINGNTRTNLFPGAPLIGDNQTWQDTLMQGVYPWTIDLRDRSNNPYIITGNLTVNATSPILDSHYPDQAMYIKGIPLDLAVFVNASVNNITNGSLIVTGPQNTGTYDFIADPDFRRINMTVPNFSVDGDYNYIGIVTDYVGNIWTVVNHNFTIDTIIPYIEFTLPTADYNSTTTAVYFQIYSETTNPQNITYTFFNGTFSTSLNNTIVGYPDNFTHNKTYTFPTQGRWGINVTVTDQANNYNTITKYPFYVDTVNPIPGRIYPNTTLSPDGSYVNNNTINFTGNATDNTGVKNVSLNITGVGNSYSDLIWVNYAYGVTYTAIGVVTTLADGIYDWFFTSYDWANRFQNTSIQRTTVDATIPIITVTNPLNGTGVNSLNPTLFISINDTNPFAAYGTWNLSNSTWSNSYTNFRGSCYQESTNTTNQSGKDGPSSSCGLNYTGTYRDTGSWNPSYPLVNCYDGIDNTRCACSATPCYIYANYTKPVAATQTLSPYVKVNATARYVYVSTGPSFNPVEVSIPPQCINADPLVYQGRIGLTGGNIPYDCYNGTAWITLYSATGGSNTQAAEESINWTVSYDVPTNITYSGLTNGGRYNLDVAVTDIVGYVGTGSSSFVVDLKAPTYTLINPATTALTTYNTSYVPFRASFNDSDPTVPEISGLGNATFTINNIDYTTVYSGESAANYAMNTSYLPDGNYTWTLKVYDTAGNLNETTGNVSIVSITPLVSYIDPTYPTGVNVSSLNLPIYLNVTLTPFANVTYRVWNSTWSNVTTYNTPIYNITFTPGQGRFYYNATVKSTANVANNTETRTIVLDVNAPNATFISPGIGYNSTNVQFVINATDNVGLQNATLNITGISYSNQTTVNLGDVVQSIVSIPVALAEGVYSWFWNLFDFTGNSYTTSTQQTTVDTTFPTIQFTSPTPNTNYLTRSRNISVAVLANDTNPINITYNIWNSTWINSTVYGPTTYNHIFTVPADGWYSYNATIVDIAGNYNATETRTVMFDITPPTATAPIFNTSSDSNTNFTLFNIADNLGLSNVTYTINGDTQYHIYPAYTTNGGSLSFFKILYNGVYPWDVVIYDMLGNSISYSGNVTVSASEPVLTFHYPDAYLYTKNIPLDILVVINASEGNNNLTNGTLTISGPQTGINGTYYFNASVDKRSIVLGYPNVSADGIYVYDVWVLDSVGNYYNSVINHTFTIDSTLPYLEFINPPYNYNNTALTVPITVFEEEQNPNNITYLIYNETWSNSTTFSTLGYPINFTHEMNFTFNPGRYTINVTAFGLAANSYTISKTFYVDLVNPNITKTGPLAPYVNTSANNFTANASDDVALRNATLNITGIGYSNLVSVNYVYGVTTTTVGIVLTLTDGVYNWFYTAYDWANNLFSTSTQQTTIDTITPGINFIAPTPDSGYNASTLSITVNVSIVEINPVNITYNIWNSTWSDSTTYPFTTTSKVFTVPASGRYYYNATTIDAVNHYNTTETRSIMFDVINPTITLINPPSTALKYYNYSTLDFSATLGDITSGLKNATLNINSNNYDTAYSGESSAVFTKNIALADAVYPWTLNVYDFSGNNNQTSGTVTIDTTYPQVVFNSGTYPTGTNVSTTVVPLSLSVTEINFANITYRIWNATWNNFTTLFTPTYTINFTLPEGVYYYNASITDIVMHTNNTETRTITLDTTAPTAVLNTPSNGTFSYLTNTNFTVNVTDNLSGVKNATLNIWNSTGEVSRTSTTNTGNLLQNTIGIVVSLADNVYNWWYNIWDFAGNTYQTTNNTVIVHTVGPVINITYPLNISYFDVNEFNYTFIEPYPAACWYSIDGGVNNISLTCGDNVTGLTPSQGTNTWSISIQDGSGFIGTKSVTFFVDTIAPTINFVAPTEVNGSYINRNYAKVNVSSFDINLDNITIYLYNYSLTNATLQNCTTFFNETIGQNQTDCVNYTGQINALLNATTTSYTPNNLIFYNLPDTLPDVNGTMQFYFFNASASDEFSTNFTDTRYFVVDTIAPTIDYVFDNVTTPNEVNNAVKSQDFVHVHLDWGDYNFANITFTIYNSTWSNTTFCDTLSIDNISILDCFTTTWYNLSHEGDYYQYYATVTDLASNTNSTDTYTIFLDTVNPNATIIAINNMTNGTIVNFTYYTNPNQTFIVNVSDNFNLANATLTVNGTLTNGTGYYYQNTTNFGLALQAVISIPLTLSDGLYSWFWNIFDSASNLFTTTTQQTIISATGPAITINFPASNNLSTAYNWNAIAVNYTIVSANPMNSTISIVGPNGYSNSSYYSYPPNLNGTTLTLNEQYNFTGLLDGIYNISVVAYDYLGNPNSATRRVYITGNAPVMNYTSPTILIGGTYENHIDVNVTATDLTPNKINTYLYFQNGSNLTLIRNYTVSNQQNSYISWPSLSNGVYYFNSSAYDTFNNTATLPTTLISIEYGAVNTTICRPLLVAGYYLIVNDVTQANGPCFTVTKPNTVVDCMGHTITASNGSGIVSNQGSTQVKNCNIVSSRDGINISSGTATITNVTTVSTGAGLRITGGSAVTATGCSLDGLYGVYLGAGTLTLSGSNIHDNTYGLYVTGSSSATVNYVNFTDNTYAIYHNVTTTFPGGSSGAMVWGPSGAGRYTNLRFTGTTTDIITLLYSNYNTFTTLTSTTAGEVRYTNSSNNQMTAGTLGTGGVILASSSKNNKFLDTTYSGTETVDSSSQLIRSWTTTVTTRDSSGNTVGGTTVHINDGSNKTVYTLPDGTVVTDVNQYINNGTVTQFNPYEVFGVLTAYGNSIFTDTQIETIENQTQVTLTFGQRIRSSLLTEQVMKVLLMVILLIGLAASTGFFVVRMRDGNSVADIWKYFIVMIIWDTVFLVLFLVLSGYVMGHFYPST